MAEVNYLQHKDEVDTLLTNIPDMWSSTNFDQSGEALGQLINIFLGKTAHDSELTFLN